MRIALPELSILLLTTTATAQIRIAEVLADPIGVDHGHQVVELRNESYLPLDTTGWSAATAGTTFALPSVVLVSGQIARVHLGAAGASTPADLFVPSAPDLPVQGTFTVLGTDGHVVDFVAWNGGQDGIAAAVAAGQWPSTLVSVPAPTQEGSSIAHYGNAAFGSEDEPDAWFADRTPTLGLPNDHGSIFNFEVGCPSLRDVPWVGLARPQSRPWLGETFWLDVFNVPATVPMAVLVIGATETPPVPLAPFGMPGCAAYVTFDVVEPVPLFGGSGIWSTVVPNDPSLVRGQFFAQAVCAYPGAPNPAQALVTNVAVMTIGSR